MPIGPRISSYSLLRSYGTLGTLCPQERLPGRETKMEDHIQTSVVIPPRTIWVLPVALMAARKSGLSQASTSPWRLIIGALGNMSTISEGIFPLGPVSAEDVRMTGRLKTLPIAACAMMLSRKRVGSKSLEME